MQISDVINVFYFRDIFFSYLSLSFYAWIRFHGFITFLISFISGYTHIRFISGAIHTHIHTFILLLWEWYIHHSKSYNYTFLKIFTSQVNSRNSLKENNFWIMLAFYKPSVEKKIVAISKSQTIFSIF